MYQVFQVNNAYCLTAGNDIKAGDVVFIDENGKGVKAVAGSAGDLVCVGVAATGATAGNKFDVVRQGQHQVLGLLGDVNEPVYANSASGVTATGVTDGYIVGYVALKNADGTGLVDVQISKFEEPEA